MDDKVFSDNNWAGLKDIGTASYSENCSQFTAIPDLNFENALINFGYDTGTADGKVLTSNINTITSLDVYSSNITNLTGIQDFVALTSLDCSINQLQSLDVTKNIALTDLHCDGNLLTFLDLSKNTSLTYINCSDNKLKGVNLKNGNYLNLDYVNSSFLNNPDFTCIQVDNKIYSDTNWSNIKEPTASYNEICVNLSTEKQVFENIAIYPNPTKDLLYLDNIVIEKVSIYDSSGHLVKTKTFTSGSTRNSVDFSGLSIGLYYAYISSEGVTSVRKIMVK